MVKFFKKDRSEENRLAVLAEELMNNDALIAAFDELREKYINGFINTLAKETVEREKIWQAIQVLESVKANLRHAIASGKNATDSIHRINKGVK